MSETFLATASCTANLIAMVRSSLDTVRKMLVGGRQSEETNAQVRQLELLEQLLWTRMRGLIRSTGCWRSSTTPLPTSCVRLCGGLADSPGR